MTGVGEGAVGFGVGCYAAAMMAEELAERFVVGKDPGEIQSIWNDFYYDTFWGKGAGAIFYAAASALEHGLWDIKGKALGVPVYELLGGKQRRRFPSTQMDGRRESVLRLRILPEGRRRL